MVVIDRVITPRRVHCQIDDDVEYAAKRWKKEHEKLKKSVGDELMEMEFCSYGVPAPVRRG
jgi:hypothetical protein